MQKIFYSIIVLILSATVFAQAPQSFKYQAVARDADGNNITNLSYLVNDQDAATKIYIDQMKAEIFTQIAGGKVTDYDGNSYNTVKIGNKIWMAENLNYTTGYGSWCYDDKESNCNTYGRLYNWETAKKVCPDGWHLPTDEEWKELEMHLGMSLKESNKKFYRGTDEGSKLKETGLTYWRAPNEGSTKVVFQRCQAVTAAILAITTIWGTTPTFGLLRKAIVAARGSGD